MDLLAKRYADPCFLLNGMIQTGRLFEFVRETIKIQFEEDEERTMWDFFLHKVFDDRSYDDFKKDIETNRKEQTMSARTIETTVQHSQSILNNFNPEGGD